MARYGTTGLAAVLTVVLSSVAAAQNGAAASAVPALRVVVSILPQVDFVQRIGGGLVAVEPLVGAGQSPHTYEPTPRQLDALAQARIYFTIGIDFEIPLVPRVQRMF